MQVSAESGDFAYKTDVFHRNNIPNNEQTRHRGKDSFLSLSLYYPISIRIVSKGCVIGIDIRLFVIVMAVGCKAEICDKVTVFFGIMQISLA